MKIFGLQMPLWATPIPLLIAGGVYGLWWGKRLDAFRVDVTPFLGARAKFGGFPYRLHADAGAVALGTASEDHRARLRAERMTVDRQPWSDVLSVVGLALPRAEIGAPGFVGATVTLNAPHGRASVDTAFGRLARLSAEFADARLAFGLLPIGMAARHFEVHVRETPIAPIALPTGPTLPTQAQIVLRGADVHLGGGDPLTLDADIALTAAAPLRSVRGWAAQQGTVEIRRLTLADAHGTVADASATIVPLPGGRLRVAGTVTTVCPRSVLAALAGASAPVPEYRARTAMRIAFGGMAGAVMPLVDAAGLGAFTVRAQEPPCPVLRR